MYMRRRRASGAFGLGARVAIEATIPGPSLGRVVREHGKFVPGQYMIKDVILRPGVLTDRNSWQLNFNQGSLRFVYLN
jgi:hypothetical protein